MVVGQTVSTNKTGNVKKDSCSVVGCWFTSSKLCEIQRINLFPFPVRENPSQAMLWRQILKLPKSTTILKTDRICELHFISGRPERQKDAEDYYPSVFTSDSVINRSFLVSLPGMTTKRPKILEKKSMIDKKYSNSQKLVQSDGSENEIFSDSCVFKHCQSTHGLDSSINFFPIS